MKYVRVNNWLAEERGISFPAYALQPNEKYPYFCKEYKLRIWKFCSDQKSSAPGIKEKEIFSPRKFQKSFSLKNEDYLIQIAWLFHDLDQIEESADTLFVSFQTYKRIIKFIKPSPWIKIPKIEVFW